MTYLTLGQASRETGVHKSTISRAIQDGRLSANHNEHGHYQIDPAELFRVFDPISSATPGNSESNPTQPLPHADATPGVAPDMVPWLVKRLESTEQELDNAKEQLDERERSLQELREAYRALPSPEQHEAELQRIKDQHRQELDSRDAEKVKLVAIERHEHEKESEKWKAELARRQEEIQAARDALMQKTEQERKARELLSQRLTEIESRGLIARLFNRQPKSTAAG